MRSFSSVCQMPRRDEPDPLAEAIGSRIRAFRQEARPKLTLEKLAYESGVAKGYLSDIESGRACPSVTSLAKLAERLGVEVFDLLTFPDEGPRHQLVDATRGRPITTVRRILAELRGSRNPGASKPK